MLAWKITKDKNFLSLHGPGNLEIILQVYPPAQPQTMDPCIQALINQLKRRECKYELEPGLMLELSSTYSPVGMSRHRLNVGNRVTWVIPAALADKLYALPLFTK